MSISKEQLQHLSPSIHPSYARLLAGHCRNAGVVIEQLFEGNSLTWEQLIDSSQYVSFEQFKRLYAKAEHLSGSDDLALDISTISQSSAHGPLGYGAISAPTVRQMFFLIQQMLATRIAIIKMGVSDVNGYTTLTIVPDFDLENLNLFVSTMVIGSLLDFYEKSTGKQISQLEVHLPVNVLSDIDRYRTKFGGATIVLGNETLKVVLPSKALDEQTLTADQYAFRNAQRECQLLIDQENKGGEFSRQVKHFLFEFSERFPQQEDVSEHFAMSTRTFIRKLKRDNTSFQSLLDEVRKELVLLRLSDTNQSIESIALSVGYVEASNFSRVFKRWFGCTPSEFRSSNKF
ncbi:hypothetical protein A3715_04820 [Oleiphilus sp. HI0009]|nr:MULTISPECIES: AraC family transcriptional regulator [unclassified Oleiphilus]KZX83426.1 hypothetical protein A3715_04820 [Oleiphilus sp. HI0009]KZY68744.1 hypothetical protein A3738_04765 [Oleiphilus sp. HI0066]KZY69826.1 hypothetical protein A3739_07750 [Oleiphilus sp. HI0067]